MCKKITVLLACFLSVSIFSNIALAASVAEVIDDFESYADSDEMNAYWVIDLGADSTVTLGNYGEGSSKGMQWWNSPSTAYVPWVVMKTHVYDVPFDWSGYDHHRVSIMLKGDSENSTEGKANLQIFDANNDMLGFSYVDVSLDNPDWQELKVDIAGGDWERVETIKFGFNHMGYPSLLLYWDNLRVLENAVTIAESDGSTFVNEHGGTDSYTVVLNYLPTANVNVTVTPENNYLDLGNGAGASVVLTFTSADWDTPQTVNVTGVDDSVSDGDREMAVSHGIASTDTSYDGELVNDTVVDIREDDLLPDLVIEDFESYADTAAMNAVWDPIINPAEVSRTLATTSDPNAEVYEGSQSLLWYYPGAPPNVDWNVWSEYTFDTPQDWTPYYGGQLVLKYKAVDLNPYFDPDDPHMQLGLTLREQDDTIIYPLSHEMHITGNWDTAVINIPQDQWGGSYAAVGKIHLGLTHETWFNATVFFDHLVLHRDEWFILTETGDVMGVSTNVHEQDINDSYIVELPSPPDSNVVVAIQTDGQTLVDVGSGFAQTAQLIFTPQNWVNRRTVIVKAVDDDVPEGDHTSTITHTLTSSDPNYNGYVRFCGDNNIVVNVADNDCGFWGFQAGDLNKDCIINLSDFAMVAEEWGADYTVIPPVIVDDFESYADTTTMQVKWLDRLAEPTGCGNTLTLLTNADDCHQGTKALQWDYDLSSPPPKAIGRCEILYDTNSLPIDLGQYDEMSVWLKRHIDNSKEYIFYIQYLNDHPDTNNVVVAGEKWILKKDGSTWNDPNEWTEWVVDLHDLKYSGDLGYNELSDINDVRGIVFGVYSSLQHAEMGDMDEGTIDIDDIELRVVPPCPVELNGDTNGDCDVNIEDLAALVDTWLDCTDPYEDGCIDVR